MEEIIQSKNESNREFIERVLNQKNSDGHDYKMIFNNGVDLSTVDYDLYSVDEILDSYKIKTARIERERQMNHFIPSMITPLVENEKVSQQEEDSITKIDDPLRFLLEASSKKYRSEETVSQISSLKSQREGLLESKNKISQRLSKEREIDMDNVFKQQKKAEFRRDQELDAIQRMIDSVETQIQLLKDHVVQQKNYLEGLKNNPDLEDSMEPAYAVQVKKEDQEKEIEIIEEYIQKNENELNDLFGKKEDLLKRKDQIVEECQKFCSDLLSRITAKYGKVTEENQRKILKFDNIPEISTINSVLQDVEEQIERLQRDPEEIYNHILEMMRQLQDPLLVKEELQLLSATISIPKVTGILKKDRTYYNTTTEEIARLETEYENLDKYIQNNSYFNQRAMIEDQLYIETIRNEISLEKKNEQRYLEELQRFEEQRQLPMLKTSLRTIQHSIKSNEKLLRDCQNQEVQKTTNSLVDQLNKQKDTIEKRIWELEKDGVIRSDKSIRRNLVSIQGKIAEGNAEIKELEGKNYINLSAKQDDLNHLDMIKKDIENLKEQQRYLGNHTIEELQDIIMNDYSQYFRSKTKTTVEKEAISEEKISHIDHPIEEEIESEYEEADRSLITKIKNVEFIKYARSAMKRILQSITNSPVIPKRIEKRSDDLISDPDASISEAMPTPMSGLENMLEDALQDYSEDLAVEEARQSLEENIRQIDSQQEVTTTETNLEDLLSGTEIGKFYAIVDNVPVEINHEEAEEYLKNGVQVITPYEASGKKTAMPIGLSSKRRR